ncbi:MAG: hypothetical protein AAF984_11000, partial [Verrucomicrobiota bacterium]
CVWFHSTVGTRCNVQLLIVCFILPNLYFLHPDHSISVSCVRSPIHLTDTNNRIWIIATKCYPASQHPR